MIRFNILNQRVALCALLLSFVFTAYADDIGIANSLYKRGQSADALTKVESILSNQPKDAQARFLKAIILNERGKTEDAIRIYTALSADYPKLPEPYNNLAVIYASQGQYEKAKTALEAALKTHPSYSTAHANLGDIYAKMASQAYDRALQLDRSNTNSKTQLALLKEITAPASKPASNPTQVASLSTTASAEVKPNTTITPPANTVTTTASNTKAASSAPVITSTELAPVTSTPNKSDPKTTDNDEEILQAVQDWAQAWSARNVNKYLAMYAKSFKTPNNESRSTWEKQRRDRVAKPQPISVSLANTKVKNIDATHANVSFVQYYRSGTLKSTTLKTLEMIKSSSGWQIQLERNGG